MNYLSYVQRIFFMSVICGMSLVAAVSTAVADSYNNYNDYNNDNNPQNNSRIVDLGQALQPPAAAEQQVQQPQTQYTDNTMPSDNMNPASANVSFSRLQQQVQNLVDMNMPQQISQLQQQIQQLTGQLQQAQHQIDLLNQKLHQQKNITSTQNAGMTMTAPQNANVTVADEAPSEFSQYQKALNFLNKKQYQPSQIAFSQYLKQYPQGQFASNSHYWLGEMALLNNHLDSAVIEFTTVINQYPRAAQVSDAHLKLAMIHLQQGRMDIGRQELMSVQKDYSNSTAAHLAGIQLQQLNLSH